MKSILPKPLQSPLRLGIVATGSPITVPESLKNKIYQFFVNLGVTVLEAPHCRNKDHYTAGAPQVRAKELESLFKDPNIDAIMSFWGGKNSNQMLEILDYDVIANHPKPFIGFSDTSVVLSAIHTRTGLVTFHGPGAICFAQADDARNYIWTELAKALAQNDYEHQPPSAVCNDLSQEPRTYIPNPGLSVWRPGQASGLSHAINLSLLLTLAGTKNFPDLRDRILFTEVSEDVDLRLLDRALTHFSQLPESNSLAGLVLGKFRSESKVNRDELSSILHRTLAGTNYPVIFDFDSSHTSPMATVPLGISCHINTNTTCVRFAFE